MRLFELQAWLGHSSPSSTQHYARITPVTLTKAYTDAGYFARNVRTIEVLLDRDAVQSGAAGAGEPFEYYDLGHGSCTYSFFEQCPHRMACARCDLYLPKESNSTQLLEAKNSLQRMLVTIPLTDDERAAVEGDEQAVDRLIDARHCRSSGSRTRTERARPQTRRTKEQANERMSRSHRSAWERANDRLARERASVPMPDQLHWDHNAHYHSYLLRQLPPRFVRALDVGCGAGAFARLLARRAVVVDAIDLSPVMIAQASAASSQPPNIRWVEGDALALALGPERYEVITAIASVHHMPLDDALRRFRHLLCAMSRRRTRDPRPLPPGHRQRLRAQRPRAHRQPNRRCLAGGDRSETPAT